MNRWQLQLFDLLVSIGLDQKITSTPLLEYIANVKQERRDDRKRKIDDRKRQRDEEKQRKKNQVVKSIPRAIEEDAKVCRLIWKSKLCN